MLIFQLKIFFYPFKAFNFCPDFFGFVRKRLDKKAKVYLKICDVTTWIKSNNITHISQYLKKQRQSDYEIRSVKYFSFKIIQKIRQRNQFQASFCFLKKLYVTSKQVVCTLVLIYFDSPPLEHTIEKLYITLDC